MTLPAPFFGDVTDVNPFFTAVQCMAETGLSTGTPQLPGAPLYRPSDPVARQAMAALLSRYDALR